MLTSPYYLYPINCVMECFIFFDFKTKKKFHLIINWHDWLIVNEQDFFKNCFLCVWKKLFDILFKSFFVTWLLAYILGDTQLYCFVHLILFCFSVFLFICLCLCLCLSLSIALCLSFPLFVFLSLFFWNIFEHGINKSKTNKSFRPFTFCSF